MAARLEGPGTGRKINGWIHLRIHHWNFGKSYEPKHHDFRFKLFIFGGGVKGMVIQTLIRLMVQKSGDHQLWLVVYPIIYKVLYIPGGCSGFLPSTAGILLIGSIYIYIYTMDI